MGRKERVICDYLILWTFTEEQPALILTKSIGPLSLHTSAIISGLECYKIIPSLLLPSINNNCIWIQLSHVEKLASDTYMCVSMHLETQIILIILHEISFRFPNLALVHALSAARVWLLLFFFFSNTVLPLEAAD